MENIILVLHVLVALAIIGLILLQQGKGAEAGASFGAGASQTIFGSAGSWNFFSKMTAILATVFFVTSFGLAVMAKNSAGVTEVALPELQEVEEVLESDVPALDASDDAVLEDNGSEDIPEVPATEPQE